MIGRYRIVKQLGCGGMGTVYEAVQAELERPVALKLLHSDFARNDEMRQRFYHEARVGNLIRHPGIVDVTDFGITLDGRVYLVMELLKGMSLSERLEWTGNRVGLVPALRLSQQIAAALAAAHQGGVIHRDLKPDNVFLVPDRLVAGNERAKILDFGIAKMLQGQHLPGGLRTRTGTVMGTLLYMSPEQLRDSAHVDDKSDVYSLGVLVFHLLAGRVPFHASNLVEMVDHHRTTPLPSLVSLSPEIPPACASLVNDMLAMVSVARPSMAVVRDQLEAILLALPEPRTAGAAVRQSLISTSSGHTPLLVGERAGNASGPAAPTFLLAEARTQRSTRRVAVTLALGGALLCAGAMLGRLVLADPKTMTDQPTPAGAPMLRTPAASQPAHVDLRSPAPPVEPPAGMVLIPGGSFSMGSMPAQVQEAMALCARLQVPCQAAVFAIEQPARLVKLGPFFADRAEVTNEDFAQRFPRSPTLTSDGAKLLVGEELILDTSIAESGIRLPSTGVAAGFTARPDRARQPVVGVTWSGAQRYCFARGRQLPTEGQWEYMARGPEGRFFPWGDGAPSCGGVVFGRGTGCLGKGPEHAGKAQGDVTPAGVRGLGGNVAEWVEDVFADRYADCPGGCVDPLVNVPGKLRVIRGGDWSSGAQLMRGARRRALLPSEAKGNVGFRCVQSIIHP